MNQHFVPQFYLRNFSSDGRQIFVYDKVLQKSFSNSIASVASKENFYDDSNKNSIENTIGDLETQAGVILKKLIETIETDQILEISKPEKSTLIKFIWLQMNRTAEARIQWGNMEPHLFSKLTNTPSSVEANKWLKNTNIIDDHITFLNSAIENSFALETFENRNFIVVKNETSVDLITSDHPVITHLHWEIDSRIYEIFIPINPRIGIWIVPKGLFKEIDEVDNKISSFTVDDNIKFYNYLQVSHCTRQLFSKTLDFAYVHQILEATPSLRDLDRQRFE